MPLIEAQQRILDSVAPLAPRLTALGAARGLVLARDVIASEMVPPFANTAMDGFAVRAADTAGATAENAVTLRIVGELAALQSRRLPTLGLCVFFQSPGFSIDSVLMSLKMTSGCRHASE